MVLKIASFEGPMILRVGFSWIPLRCRGCTGCTAALFSHCVKESDSSRLFCSICRSNCGQMLLQFGILTGSRTVCLSAAYASTVCLCSRVRSFSKKWCERVRPYYSPEGAASTFGIYLGYCMYLHEEIPCFCSVAAIC